MKSSERRGEFGGYWRLNSFVWADIAVFTIPAFVRLASLGRWNHVPSSSVMTSIPTLISSRLITSLIACNAACAISFTSVQDVTHLGRGVASMPRRSIREYRTDVQDLWSRSRAEAGASSLRQGGRERLNHPQRSYNVDFKHCSQSLWVGIERW